MTRNVEEWDPALQALAAEYSPGLVITAFGVREKLAKEGYEGIHFTEETEKRIRTQNMNVKNKIEKQMNLRLSTVKNP